jgi:hypothetical protein
LLFNFALDCVIRKVQENKVGLKLNGTHKLVVYTDVSVLGRSIHTVEQNTKTSVLTSKQIGEDVNAEESK